jgi:hypothetical protein
MKALLSTLCLALFAMASPNTLSSMAPCRTAPDSQMTLSEQIAHDLVQGVWTADLPSAKDEKVRTILQFDEAGQLDRMELQPLGNYLRKRYSWKVEVSGDDPVLLLYDLDAGRQSRFDLKQTCDGLELTDLQSGRQLSLVFHAHADSTELTNLRRNLIGEWANSLYPFEMGRNGNRQMAGAFLYYRFNADGTYSKSLGNSEAQLDETGEWEISADGEYLLMHSDEFQGGRKVKKTTVARIKFVMFEEMVLEHSLQVSDESFCTEQKDFYFSRV